MLTFLFLNLLKTYIISHHSQTMEKDDSSGMSCLRPILFHIILKLNQIAIIWLFRLRPILFHIILKLWKKMIAGMSCLRPILFHIILKLNQIAIIWLFRLRPILFHIILKLG